MKYSIALSENISKSKRRRMKKKKKMNINNDCQNNPISDKKGPNSGSKFNKSSAKPTVPKKNEINAEMRMSDKRTCGDGVVYCRHSDQYKGISRKLLPGQVLDTLYRHSADSETVWWCQESGVRTHFTYLLFTIKVKIILCYIWYKLCIVLRRLVS